MTQQKSKALIISLNVDSILKETEGKVKTVSVKNEEEAKDYVLKAAKYKYVVVLRLVHSIDDTFIRLPFGQEIGFMGTLIDYLREQGFDVGAYSIDDNTSHYQFVWTSFYGPKKSKTKVYEIVAPSLDPLRSSLIFLKKYFGDKD